MLLGKAGMSDDQIHYLSAAIAGALAAGRAAGSLFGSRLRASLVLALTLPVGALASAGLAVLSVVPGGMANNGCWPLLWILFVLQSIGTSCAYAWLTARHAELDRPSSLANGVLVGACSLGFITYNDLLTFVSTHSSRPVAAAMAASFVYLTLGTFLVVVVLGCFGRRIAGTGTDGAEQGEQTPNLLRRFSLVSPARRVRRLSLAVRRTFSRQRV